MNPLSPLTYYLRHKRQTLLLMSLISLATLGVCIMVRLLDSGMEQSETTDRYLTRFSVVSALGSSLEPGVVSQIRANPDVAHAIPEKGLYIDVPMIGALPGSFRLFGVSEADLQVLMDICDLRLKEGRLLRPRTNEILLSKELADTLGLQIGDQIGRLMDESRYWDILTPMVLVGILESDRVGICERRCRGLADGRGGVCSRPGLHAGRPLCAERSDAGLVQPCALAVHAAHPVGRRRRQRGHDRVDALQARSGVRHREEIVRI